MQAVNRTAQCRKCGGVIFKIKPSTGYVIYYCADCNEEVATVKYDKYETALSTCEKCEGDLFKVRITIDEKDNSTECWKSECVNCKGAPKLVYIDNNGNLINKKQRELLVINDRVKELEDEVDELEDMIDTKNATINQLEDEVDDLNYKIKKRDGNIEDLENELGNAESKIFDLEAQVSDLEWNIEKLKE